jgi:carbon-monoxide dehydrogenase large subunit
VPPGRVNVVECAPGTQLRGSATTGSRSTVGAGSACHLAAQKLIEEGKALAALELHLEPSQIDYAHGTFSSVESKRRIALAELAKAKPLAVKGSGAFGATFPNGCHIAEVEVDPETGKADIVSYCAVDDCGMVIHHGIVEGQLHGGVVQGAGQVFGEHMIYDRQSGQPLTASFMDYYMPRAGLIPGIRAEEHATPSTVSPLGVKGVGESGCTASVPVLVAAAMDALRPLDVTHLDMPLTPARLWQAIQDAQRPDN